VAPAYNPSYSGSRDQKEFKASHKKIVQETQYKTGLVSGMDEVVEHLTNKLSKGEALSSSPRTTKK
jgi:hypothetical protein